jgi:hypothetical protein
MVSKNVGFVANLGISRRIFGKDKKHPKRTPQRKQRKLILPKQVHVHVHVWLMKYSLLVMLHINIRIGF